MSSSLHVPALHPFSDEYYVLNGKNTFCTDSVLGFSNTNKMVNGKNLFLEEIWLFASLSQKLTLDTPSLRLVSPVFPQVSPRIFIEREL